MSKLALMKLCMKIKKLTCRCHLQNRLKLFLKKGEVMKTIYAESRGEGANTTSTQLAQTSTQPIQPTQSAFSNLLSSIASIGQVPKAIATSISSSLTRSPRLQHDDAVLEGFRERIMATNSANDLMIRDINLLLEDYKNLLYILFKQ